MARRIVGIDEAEAPAVRLAFKMRAQGAGLGAISNGLEREGFRSKTGKPRISVSALSDLLRNPLFAGLVRLSDGELIEAQHEAIVPRDVWERVQRTWLQTNTYARHHAGVLSGLLVCSGCGYKLHHERANRGFIYRCPSRNRSVPCNRQVVVRADYVEEFVQDVFLRRFDPKLMPNGGKLRRAQPTSTRKIARLRGRVEELTRALDSLADDRFVKGTITADEYGRQPTRYAEERAQVEAEADELDRPTATVQPPDKNVLETWFEQTVETRRRGLRMFIDEIIVSPTPRVGRGQRPLVPERLEIAWLRQRLDVKVRGALA